MLKPGKDAGERESRPNKKAILLVTKVDVTRSTRQIDFRYQEYRLFVSPRFPLTGVFSRLQHRGPLSNTSLSGVYLVLR